MKRKLPLIVAAVLAALATEGLATRLWAADQRPNVVVLYADKIAHLAGMQMDEARNKLLAKAYSVYHQMAKAKAKAGSAG